MTYKRYVVEVRDPNRTLRRISVWAVSVTDALSQITPLNPSAEMTAFVEVKEDDNG